MFWRCKSIVHHYGIILNNSLSLIMECLPLGPLDRYLQATNVQLIDLIEAATNLANAVFYLVFRFSQQVNQFNMKCPFGK